MAKKTVKLNKAAINSLPNNKPAVYRVVSKYDDLLYVGVAKKGRVRDRVMEHLPGKRGTIPGGAKVQIEQQAWIEEAEKKESGIISRSTPKYNQQGK